MENVDMENLSQFKKISHQWWDPKGPFKPLHIINPARLQFIDSLTHLHGKRVLDVGCGGGLIAEAMATRGAHVTGIDLDENAILVAKAHAEKFKLAIDYHVTAIEQFKNHLKAPFDVITCLELIEHVPDPEKLITDLAACLKPRGILILSTLNRTPQAYLGAIVAAEYILKLLPKKTHNYKQFIKPAELAAWMRKTGIPLDQIRGIAFNPLLESAALRTDVKINYICSGVKIP